MFQRRSESMLNLVDRPTLPSHTGANKESADTSQNGVNSSDNTTTQNAANSSSDGVPKNGARLTADFPNFGTKSDCVDTQPKFGAKISADDNCTTKKRWWSRMNGKTHREVIEIKNIKG